jgi:hypothetical protein
MSSKNEDDGLMTREILFWRYLLHRDLYYLVLSGTNCKQRASRAVVPYASPLTQPRSEDLTASGAERALMIFSAAMTGHLRTRLD